MTTPNDNLFEKLKEEEKRVLTGQKPNAIRIIQLLRRLFSEGKFNITPGVLEIGTRESIKKPQDITNEQWNNIMNQVLSEADALRIERGKLPSTDDVTAGVIMQKQPTISGGNKRKSKKTKSKSRK